MRRRKAILGFQVAAFLVFFLYAFVSFGEFNLMIIENREETRKILAPQSVFLNEENVEEFISHLKLTNSSEETILNEEKFDKLQNDSVIIVVQVHKRITYLRHLIKSFSKSPNISKTLLIFSHDFYDEEINELVQSIDFCKVMQIFYPFSIQNHSEVFPGTDPKDCERDLKKDQAVAAKCQNANFPDLYGHYREAAYTQTKHHWWWKANRVFDQLEVMRFHTGLVLFLEEDHYVAEDFLHILQLMEKSSPSLCQRCNVVSLGTYKTSLSSSNSDKVKCSNFFFASLLLFLTNVWIVVLLL